MQALPVFTAGLAACGHVFGFDSVPAPDALVCSAVGGAQLPAHYTSARFQRGGGQGADLAQWWREIGPAAVPEA